jgi:integrase
LAVPIRSRLLVGPRDGVITTATLRDATGSDQLVNALGLTGLVSHGLRHTALTWMADAVAHTILVSAYWMLKRDVPYHDLGVDWHTRRNDQAHTRRLVAQLERLGHTVIIDPAA